MNTNYAPFVTPEKYAQLVGLTVEAVKCQVQAGKLPVLKRDSTKRGRTLINMVALQRYAEEQAEEFEDWKSNI